MPALKTYDLFISHAWQYGNSYDRLVKLLDDAPYFYYRNYSAPSENPLRTLKGTDAMTKRQIMDAIERKIKPVNCVLIISGLYTSHHEWMQYEIETAVRLGKPVIGIVPWGNTEVPAIVRLHSDTIVNWNTDSIVRAIRDFSI